MPKSKSTPVRPADADTARSADDVSLSPLSQLQRKPSTQTQAAVKTYLSMRKSPR